MIHEGQMRSALLYVVEAKRMKLAGIAAYKTIVMTILALVGVLIYKWNIVDDEMNRKLSELVLTVLTPVLLFTSFQKEFSSEMASGLLISTGLSALAFLIIWGISKLVINKKDKDYAALEHIAIMYSNCGFIGIPMAQGLFGSDGVFYMTAFVAMANFLLWSHGVIVMSGKSDLKSLIKVFTSPTILSIVTGIICFCMQIRIPKIIEEPMEMIASMNTPMAMIVAGINIAQVDLRKTFSRLRVYWMCVVRLLIMPFAVIGVLYFLSVPQEIKTIIVLASACPVGVTGSLFALRYGKDAGYASELFAMSTVVSIVTIPFLMVFC
ncbi:MAG: AEC family transporter [bacterium]|nr:AEC family transporter [bacterium]